MKPSRWGREYGLADSFIDIVSEWLPEGVSDVITTKDYSDLAESLVDEVKAHMDAQYDAFRDEVLK